MTASITLSTDALEAVVANVKSIDSKLESAKGTAAVRKASALEAVKASTPDTFAAIADLEDKLADLRQSVEDAVTEAVKASSGAKSGEVEALKAERETLVNTAKAMATLLNVATPDLGKAPRSGSGGGHKASTGEHYRMVNGEPKSYANSTLSGLAFYGFKRAPVEAVQAALASVGVTDLAKPWETPVTVNDITLTIGHKVVSDEAPAAE